MSKANEIMTKSLAICRPDDNAADVASVMKERDIGNVLVVEDGKLHGIVTDRDLAVNALTDLKDAQHAPISRYMSKNVVTGSSGWNLNKVAKVMAKHQIRRLPIVDDGEVVGIISLGDVARFHNRKDVVTNSLKDISTPEGILTSRKNSHIGTWLGLSLLAASSVLAGWLTWSHTGQDMRKQVIKSKPYHSAKQAVGFARDKVNDAATSKKVLDIRRQLKSNIDGLTQQLPSIQYKPPKHRRAWFI